jgi:uncharacterized protein YbaP (TraB family)
MNLREDADPTCRAWLGCALRAVCAALVVALSAATAVVAAEPARVAAVLTPAQQRAVLDGIDAVGRRGFLYAVSRPSPSDRTLYLYGTMHLGRIGSEPFNAAVMNALKQSSRLAIEADPSDNGSTQALALRLGQYAADDGLQRHIPPDLMARVQAFGDRNGLPAERLGRFRPWLLANMVALSSLGEVGLDPAMGSELYLTGYARSARLPVVEIEGVEAQLRMLASLPDALQAAQLDEALAEVDSAESRDQTRALFDLWLHGDRPAGDALIDEMRRDADGKVFERYFIETLIDRRNKTMADRAESELRRPGNTFFAVGALHLFGEAGLIREFERRGYRVVDLQPPLAAPSAR